MSNAISVRNNDAESRFEVEGEGQLAVLEYRLRGDRIVFIHTGVPEPMAGQGIGSALARAGLNFARANGLTVVPYCPFVRSYIERHPEFQDLVERS